MKSTKYEIRVNIPSLEDFAAKYPQYGPRAAGEGKVYFDLVMRPETFVRAAALTDCTGLPAVTAVAEEAAERGPLEGTDKQFMGALVCALMEANDRPKTGRKRAIPHPAWNRGEVYTKR